MFTLESLYVHSSSIYELYCEWLGTGPRPRLHWAAYRLDITREMLSAEGIVLIRRNRWERSRTAHARLGLHFTARWAWKGLAPNDAVLDGFVELGRFLGPRASHEWYL